MDYPNDADGDSLRRVREAGSDMSLPMTIDFAVDVASESAARAVASLVSTHGFDPSISDNEGRGFWSIYCSKTMLATYDAVVSVRALLNALTKAHGGSCDSWASFGNAQSRP